MPKRKVCKTVKGKRICNKKPQMNASDIITLQMNALQRNNKYDSGIKLAYKYASDDNKLSTGPYSRFNKMVKNNMYKHLLKCKKWSFVKNTIQKIKDEKYSRIVKVQSSHDDKEYTYRFSLSRQIPSLFWRTDSVELIEGVTTDTCSISPIQGESKDNIQLNIYDEPLQVCSTDPMTGWKRDGKCSTHEDDSGTHTVCARVNDEFLEYTNSKGNDLSTPRGRSFPGLKDGDHWCLCALRWSQALKAGKAPPLNLNATNKKTLDHVDLDTLEQYGN